MVLYAAPVRGPEDQRTRAVGAVGAGVMRRSKRRTPIALCADHRSRANIEKPPRPQAGLRGKMRRRTDAPRSPDYRRPSRRSFTAAFGRLLWEPTERSAFPARHFHALIVFGRPDHRSVAPHAFENPGARRLILFADPHLPHHPMAYWAGRQMND
jgi:hypothetical protein